MFPLYTVATITFYDLLHKNEIFSSYTMISSNVPLGEQKKVIYKTDKSPIIFG